MEDIFGILAFVLFLTIGLWQTYTGKGKKNRVRGKQLARPPFEPMGKEIPPVAQPLDMHQAPTEHKPVSCSIKKAQSKNEKGNHEYSFTPEEEGKRNAAGTVKKKVTVRVDEPSSDAPVCMHSPEEARRAFIYSEIFNRKY